MNAITSPFAELTPEQWYDAQSDLIFIKGLLPLLDQAAQEKNFPDFCAYSADIANRMAEYAEIAQGAKQ